MNAYRPMAVAALAGLLAAGCTPSSWSFRRGVQLYDGAHYADAYAAFRRAFARTDDPRVAYNAGDALYRMKHYEAAARSFHPGTIDPRLQQRSYFNTGNAWVRYSEDAADPGDALERAIATYENALQLDPKDRDAKWNLEYAVRRLEENREHGGSPGRGRQRADYGTGNQRSGRYEGNPEAAVGAMAGGGHGGGNGESAHELTPAEAKRLLESVQREQLTTHEGHRLTHTTPGGRDW